MLAPTGDVIRMVPVGARQVGCTVTEATGVAGAAGKGFIVIVLMFEIQPVTTFFAVIL